MAFNFIKENWDKLKTAIVGVDTLATIVQSIGDGFNTETELKEFIKFRDDHQKELVAWERTIQQSFDRANNNVDWMKRNYRRVIDWLERSYPN